MEILFSNLKNSFLSTDIKLILVVFTVLTIGFFSLYVVYDFSYLQDAKKIDLHSKNFFSQDFSGKNLVFILGSS